ncbi:protein kinase-like protein [Novymonas esmeraldas]|uniref:Protein kinase-like protein n=1 Tax=Novymonas esmeraldas TaxID=1808958 RepID=A0AAW0ENA8_9TRYP
MGDSQVSSVYSRNGGTQSITDVNSIMTANGAALRNSGVLSPLAWQAARPFSSASLTVLGLTRRDAPSTSSHAPWNMSPNAGQRRRHHPRGHEHSRAPTPSSPSSASPPPPESPALVPGGPFSIGTATVMTSAERNAFITGLSGFHGFATRLLGNGGGDRATSIPTSPHTLHGDADAAHGLVAVERSPRASRSPMRPQAPSPTQLQSGPPPRRPPSAGSAPAAGDADGSYRPPRSPSSASHLSSAPHELRGVGAARMSPDAPERRSGGVSVAGGKEGSGGGSSDSLDMDCRSTAPTTGPPPPLSSLVYSASHTQDSEAPPDVETVFHNYLEHTRYRILHADSSDTERAVELDGLLMRCQELFSLLGDMYAVAQEQHTVVDRKRLSMVKVLPYDEVSATTSSSSRDNHEAGDGHDGDSVSSSTSAAGSSRSSSQHSGGSASQREKGKSATPFASTTRPRASQLPPLSGGAQSSAAAVVRTHEAFERGRRTSVSSTSSNGGCIEVLNNYCVTRLVGVGATGRVYLAVDRQTCKTFAIKTVPRHSRKAVARRFPLASVSESESEALPLDGSPLEAVQPDVSRVHSIVPRPLNMYIGAARPLEQRDKPRDSMDVSLREAALESLLLVVSTGHQADSVIPFVESQTASMSAAVSAASESETRSTGKTLPPRASSGKALRGPASPTRSTPPPPTTVVQPSIPSDGASSNPSGGPSASAPATDLIPVEREIRIMRRVRNHPHVVQLKEVIDDEDEDTVHLVMTYAEKGPLTVMHNFDTMFGCAPCDVVRPFSRCARLLRQLAEALIYTHRQRIVHNDVKPDNILLTEADTILLTDFGESVLIPKNASQLPASRLSFGPVNLAGGEGMNASVLVPHNRWKPGRGDGDSWATLSTVERSASCSYGVGHFANLSQMAGDASFLPDSSMFLSAGVDVEGRLNGNRSAIGTPAFAAPELIETSTCSYDSDAWSFGVVVYAVIFGRLPFAAATISDTFDEILHGPLSFPALEEVPQRVGMSETTYDQWVEICTKLLVREPQQRLPLTSVLRHPLFRTASAVGVRHTAQPAGIVELPRGRRPLSGLHGETPFSAALRRSIRSGQVSRPMSGREVPPLIARGVRTTMPPAMSREAAAAAAAAAAAGGVGPDTSPLSSRLVSTADSFVTSSTMGSSTRDSMLHRHRLQTVVAHSQTSSLATAATGMSSASVGEPAALTGLPVRAKAPPHAAVNDPAATPPRTPNPQLSPKTHALNRCATQPASPAVRHPLTSVLGTHLLPSPTSSPTAAAVAAVAAAPDRGLQPPPRHETAPPSSRAPSVAELAGSVGESPISRSLFSASVPLRASPPEGTVTAGTQSTSGVYTASPVPRPLTRAGSITPDFEASTGGLVMSPPSESVGGAASVAAAAAAAAAVAAVVAAPAPPSSSRAASAPGRPRSGSAARDVPESGDGPTLAHTQRRRSEEEPCEGEGNSAADSDYFSYWDSMSDVSGGLGAGSVKDAALDAERDEGESPRPKPPPRMSRARSSGSSGRVTPLMSVQEVAAQYSRHKGRNKRVKFVPSSSTGDATLALGGSSEQSAAKEAVQETRGAESPAQRRVAVPSPPTDNSKSNSPGRRSLSPQQPPRDSAVESPSASGTKSRFWRHR